MKLKFTVNRVAAVEENLGVTLPILLSRMQSDEGLGLVDLRAFVAAGSADEMYDRAATTCGIFFSLDLAKAGVAIERVGINAASKAVGVAMGAFLARVSKGV